MSMTHPAERGAGFSAPRNRLARGRVESLLARHPAVLTGPVRAVVEAYWGIGRERLPLGELAARMGATPERVRRLRLRGESALAAAELETVTGAAFVGPNRAALKRHEDALRPLLGSARDL